MFKWNKILFMFIITLIILFNDSIVYCAADGISISVVSKVDIDSFHFHTNIKIDSNF